MDVFPLPTYVDYSYRDEWSDKHKGTDIFADAGAPVVAVASGLARAQEDPKGGHVIYLTSPDGWSYYYAHLTGRISELEAAGADGLQVTAGQVIGTVGNSGNAQNTSPHLHFQMWSPEAGTVDPFVYLQELDPHEPELPNLPVQPNVPNPPLDLPQVPAQPEPVAEAGGGLLVLLGLWWFFGKKRRR